MSFFNRRFTFFLLMDAGILLVLAGIFAAINHSFVGTPSHAAVTTSQPQIKPTANVIPQTLATRKATGSIMESKAGDEFDLKRLRSKTAKVVEHTVQMGENPWTLAKKNDIDVLTLIGANPTLPYKFSLKLKLNLLSLKGALHTVAKGETLAMIASDYGLEEKALKDENGISWWHGLKEGDVLFLPGAKPLLMTKEWQEYYSRRGMFGDPLGRWTKINSTFGGRIDPLTGDERHHNGVDLKAKYGDPVYAAGTGRVVFTGVSGGYGNLIVIAHANGYTTYYGHLSKIYVTVGQHVHRGVGIIGRVGATGRVTGPHLHFEVRLKGKAKDPLLFI